MLKILKYDLMGKYKFIAGGCLILALVNILLLLGVNVIWTNAPDGLALAFSGMFLGAAIIVAFIDGVKSLYINEGYMLLVLPQKGWGILAAKLLGTFIEIFIFSIVGLVLLLVQSLKYINLSIAFARVIEAVGSAKILKAIAFSSFDSILGFLLVMLIIYFAQSAARSIINRKRSRGWISFLVFSGVWTVYGIVQYAIVKIFPLKDIAQSVVMGNMVIGKNSTATIATLVFEILVIVGMFYATSYLIENKVEA